jgi:hypothetical protein
LRGLAYKYRLDKDDVISNAMRFYWKFQGNDIILCPVRKIDEDDFYRHEPFNTRVVLSLFSLKEKL